MLDRELPEWLDQLDPVIAPAVRSAESLSALEYLARVARLADLAPTAAAGSILSMSLPHRRSA